MADKHTDFWLPPEFLTDDDILMDPYHFENSAMKSMSRSNLFFPSEFSHDLCSSSPVDSAVGSTENESDEEDILLSGLTRRLLRTSIGKATKSGHARYHLEKGWVMPGSPQSTLAQVGSWTGRSTGSSNGSPNGPSQVSSPPTTPLGAETDAWGLMFHDGGQVDCRKMNTGDGFVSMNRVLPDLPRRVTPAHPVKGTISGVHISPCHQIRAGEVMQHPSSEMWGQRVNSGLLAPRRPFQPRGPWVGSGPDLFLENGKFGRDVLGGSVQPSAAWHSLQLQHQNHIGGPGMRAVFSGGSGGGTSVGMKRECAGTGVFIPRRYGFNNTKMPSDPRKKTAKVVNGVNRSLEGFNGLGQPQMLPCANGGLISDYDLLIARRNAAMLVQKMRSLSPEVSISPELCLPQEWTY